MVRSIKKVKLIRYVVNKVTKLVGQVVSIIVRSIG